MSLINGKGSIGEAKVGDFSIAEAFGVGISKSITENLLSRVVGNGNWMSGTSKLLMAWGVTKVPYIKNYTKNKFSKMVLTAIAIDGVEDITRSIFSGGVVDQNQGGVIF